MGAGRAEGDTIDSEQNNGETVGDPSSAPFLARRSGMQKHFGRSVTILFVLFAATATAQEARPPSATEIDPILGRWELDVRASRFDPGPPPQRELRLYEPEHEGIKATVATTDASGRTTTFEYVTSYNDVVSSVTGSETSDAIRMRKIDAYTAEADLSLNGRVVGRTRRVVSRDGQTMTITLRREAPVRVTNELIYRRR